MGGPAKLGPTRPPPATVAASFRSWDRGWSDRHGVRDPPRRRGWARRRCRADITSGRVCRSAAAGMAPGTATDPYPLSVGQFDHEGVRLYTAPPRPTPRPRAVQSRKWYNPCCSSAGPYHVAFRGHRPGAASQRDFDSSGLSKASRNGHRCELAQPTNVAFEIDEVDEESGVGWA